MAVAVVMMVDSEQVRRERLSATRKHDSHSPAVPSCQLLYDSVSVMRWMLHRELQWTKHATEKAKWIARSSLQRRQQQQSPMTDAAERWTLRAYP